MRVARHPAQRLIATVMPDGGFRHDLHATYTKLVDLFASPSSSPCRCIGFSALFFLGRRWPSGIPSNRAFCLRAPGVRLSALETVLTGVLFLECCLSSFTSARVQSRRTTRFRVAVVLAINLSPFLTGSDSTAFGPRANLVEGERDIARTRWRNNRVGVILGRRGTRG